MIKIAIIWILSLVPLTISAQDVYFDLEDKRITKEKFDRLRFTERLTQSIEIIGDTTYTRLFPFIKNGYLGKERNHLIWNRLQKSTEEDLSAVDFICIRYLHGIKECGGSWTSKSFNKRYRNLKSKLSEIGIVAYVDLYYGKTELHRYDKVGNFCKDEDGYIAEVMIGGHATCKSHILLTRDGYFITVFGETEIGKINLKALELYNYQGKITRVDGKPIHIIGSLYYDQYSHQIDKETYQQLKISGKYKSEVSVVENVKMHFLKIL